MLLNIMVWQIKGYIVHVPFDDPPALASGLTYELAILPPYRRVRDEIGEFVKSIEKLINGEN